MAKRIKRSWILLFALAVAVAAAAVLAGSHFRLFDRAVFTVRQWYHASGWRERSMWLAGYTVVVDAKPVDGVASNLSGLTWNGDTGTLFAVVNNPAAIVELSTGGALLRRIAVSGMADPEAIEYIGDDIFIVADEQAQRLVQVTIGGGTGSVDARNLPRISIGMGNAGNKGIEGLAWDGGDKKLYAAKEKRPVHIYEVTGFPQSPGSPLNVEVTADRDRDRRLFVTDVSSLAFDQRYRHLLVLSDESRILLELDADGHPISSLSLQSGHGLENPVPQPEGVAVDGEGTLYIVSEPNLLYIFRPGEGR